ncbi:MAG: hypothetical protein K9W43_06860 [Candidatus Thorarchaeota archaeon]|nr:hypothetical protein [Candidatus Thorarchaeota archaeon]
MSDEGVRRLIEEATKESLNQSFVEAGQKYITAAETLEQKGDYEGAKKLYIQAADAYEKAATKYRDSKSFKNAALNMCKAGDVYSDIADSDKAIRSYAVAAEDLYLASDEYLMWGEPKETEKGVALAVTASLIYLMIGMEDKGFQTARAFMSKNASKLQFPATVRLSQIPQMLESALKSINLESFASAENAVVTELKAALANANAQQFVTYVEKGLNMAREILRGQLKVPKISAHLDLPVDMTFSEEFPLQVVIKNDGDGDALQLKLEWVLDEGLKLSAGDKIKALGTVAAGQQITLEIKAKAADETLMGAKEYQVLVRGTYADMLNTEYSLQAGPGTFVLRDYKVTEKLQHDADVSDGRISLLKDTVATSDLEQEPILRLIDGLSATLTKAREEIQNKELDAARARINVINEMVDVVDNLMGDEEMAKRLQTSREEAQKTYARGVIISLQEELTRRLDKSSGEIESQVGDVVTEWDRLVADLKSVVDDVAGLRQKLSDVKAEIDKVYGLLPTASTTDDPAEATRRTQVRKSVEAITSKISELRTELERMTTAPALQPGTHASIPDKVRLTKETIQNLKSDIGNLMEQKKAEL